MTDKKITEDEAAIRAGVCVRCATKPHDGGPCCSTHGKRLCHRCYRVTHFVILCVDGCSSCQREGLPLNLDDLRVAAGLEGSPT